MDISNKCRLFATARLFALLILAIGFGAKAQTVDIPLADALDNGELTWKTSAQYPWVGETTLTHDGIDAATSPQLDPYTGTFLSTSVTGPARISFWWYFTPIGYSDSFSVELDSSYLFQPFLFRWQQQS